MRRRSAFKPILWLGDPPAAPSHVAPQDGSATGVITFVEDGKKKRWVVSCMARETARTLKRRLKRWRPSAKFLSAKIVPDKPKG